MVRHDFHFENRGLDFGRFRDQQLFQSRINSVHKHLASIFGTEYNMVFTVKCYIVVTLNLSCHVVSPTEIIPRFNGYIYDIYYFYSAS